MDEVQASLLGGAIGFASIAWDAGTDNVLPGGGTAPIARDDVVQIEIVAVEKFTAILTGVSVAFEDIMTGELHFLFGQADRT